MRGEFIRGDGLVIPNNVTIAGAQAVLQSAFRGLATQFWLGLCSGVYTPTMTTADITEPTLGSNGYERQSISATASGWPTLATLNGESYVESGDVIFAPTGAGFDQPISRMFMVDSATGSNLLMLGGSLPSQITLKPDTPSAQRTFRYRFYLR